MPISFDTHKFTLREPEDIMVSRISAPKPKPVVRLPMKRRTNTSANAFFYGPPPIEEVLRQRQTLAPCLSDPTLTLRSKPMLPRIGTARAVGRLDEPGGRSGPAYFDRYFGTPQDYARWGAKSHDGRFSANLGGVTLLTIPRPGLDSNIDAWCGITNGEYQMQVPFVGFCRDDHTRDSDAFVRWYKQQEATRDAENSRKRCPPPHKELLPWEGEREIALSQVRTADPFSGKALRCTSKADLFDHLDRFSSSYGLEALLDGMSFRLSSLENAAKVLDCNGSGQLGLMDFAGSLSILGLDSQVLAGMGDHSIFLGLDRDRDGLIMLKDLLRLKAALKPSASSKQKQLEQTQLPGSSSLAVEAEPITLDALRLVAPEAEPHDILRAMSKWCHVARWMASASQRSVAMKVERLLKGWRAKNGSSDGAEDAGDTFVTSASIGSADTAAQGAAPARKTRKSLMDIQAEDEAMLRAGRWQRRRPAVSAPRELTFESLDAMQEQEVSLKAMFIAGSSQKLPNGTSEMSRNDLDLFFQDLELADFNKHKRVHGALLDKLYSDAIAMQQSFNKSDSGLSFMALKIVLNNVIEPLGLDWRGLIEAGFAPQVLAAACAAESKGLK